MRRDLTINGRGLANARAARSRCDENLTSRVRRSSLTGLSRNARATTAFTEMSGEPLSRGTAAARSAFRSRHRQQASRSRSVEIKIGDVLDDCDIRTRAIVVQQKINRPVQRACTSFFGQGFSDVGAHATRSAMPRLFARSLMLQLITLCTALGVLFVPVAEAAECAGEPPVASQLEQHGDPGDDDRGPEKHGTCAHGHCHHASHAVRSLAGSVALDPSASVLRAADQPRFDSGPTELTTPPPRA